ncbi:MAG: glycine--tRNA ligase subunit beta [Gammaproteobacteria bacterium]
MKDGAKQDLLIEIGTEELPASAQTPLAEALDGALRATLAERGITSESTEVFSTPRRLAVLARGIHEIGPERRQERRGPSLAAAFDAEGKPTRAATGFASSAGVEVEALETLRTDKGEWLVHRWREPGRPTLEVLADILPGILTGLPLKRRMRWGAGEATFLRPVRWLLARYGETVVPMEAFGLAAGGASRGHRFHHPGAVEIPVPRNYTEALCTAKVIAEPAVRRAEVERQITEKAREAGGVPAAPPGLIAEITGMIEWPVTIAAAFDEKYLDLPEAVLVTTLAHHQRFIPLRGADGALMTCFLAVTNLESRAPERLCEGLERVVRPRLEDAAFYYRRDRERPLADYAPALAELAFGAKLGSVADKSARLETLAAGIAEAIGADAEPAARAARLSKCDLTTGMVFEFPELQGVIGGYYAAADGEDEAVAAAIAEQYLPAGAQDALPQTPAGAALALADRLDTLIGGFASGRAPTGTKDAFGLRRAAFALLRIAVERAPDLDFAPWLHTAAELYPASLQAGMALPALTEFLRERLRSMLLEAGHAADLAQAVLVVAPLAPAEVLARATALAVFRRGEHAEALAAANKRIANLLRQAETRKEAADPDAAIPADAGAETTLAGALANALPNLDAALAEQNFELALTVLAALRESVDQFFDEVLVMDPDPVLRTRRLGLLARLRAAFLRVADIGELQPTTVE